MSDHIAPQNIALFAPGIDDKYSLSKLPKYSMSVTPDKITPQKMELPVIRNMHKNIKGGMICIMGGLIQLF